MLKKWQLNTATLESNPDKAQFAVTFAVSAGVVVRDIACEVL